MESQNSMHVQNRKGLKYAFILSGIGLAVNYLFAHLATGLHLPLYLDNIGSAMAAALGGYIPGIIAGFLTNLVNGVGDANTAYYGTLTVLIAIASAWFSSPG